MLPDYADIRKRIKSEPLWFDEGGVPRYDAFRPAMLGIYDTYAVYYEIACQACHQRFNVAEGWQEWEWRSGALLPRPLPSPERIKGLHYGDPPRHDCPGAGESMNCDDLRVLEFWRKDCDCEKAKGEGHAKDCGRFDWRRDSSLEIPLQDAEP